MSKIHGVKCDICDRIIEDSVSVSWHSSDPTHIFFPLKFQLIYGFGEDSDKSPKHMCYDCFKLFKAFVEECNRRKKEKETTNNGKQ